MNAEESLALISYRLERSRESLRAAEIMLENSMLTFSMNRVYYAMFYAVQALLVSRKVSFSKHGQVKAYFNREIVKTGIFPAEMGRLYNRALSGTYRQKAGSLSPHDQLAKRSSRANRLSEENDL
ncbi:MAG: HEPN domain-containing protein [PVC group bacterium]